MKKLTFLFYLLSITLISNAQQGDKYFSNKQYGLAAIAYIDEAALKPEKYKDLAKAYFGAKDYGKALEAMLKYKEKYSKADSNYADWFIEMMKRSDNNVPMRPILGMVNTSGDESVPRISVDGTKLYFKGVDRSGGYGGEDIWYAEKLSDGTWGKPILFTDLSTDSHETLYTISADGRFAVLFGNYEGSFGNGDLFYSVKTSSGWSSPCNLGGTINTAKWEAQATISPDGKVLVFVSQSFSGNKGGYDLYMSKLTDKGWTKPENLGSVVNTKSGEIRPSFAADGKTLYFSSDGHNSFGGYDIFMTKRLDESYTNWSTPVNLGRFINTLQDDEDITVNAEGTIGYTVKDNEVGAPGGSDIFQFVMPEIARPEQTLTLYGFVTNEKDSASAVNLRFTSLKNNVLYKIVPSEKEKGAYKVNLPFDKYLMEINMKGFLYYSEEIDLSDPSKFLPQRSIQDFIGVNKNEKLSSDLADIDNYNKQLHVLKDSVSYDLKNSFEKYEDVFEKYNKALLSYKTTVLESKYDWLSEEKKFVDVMKNFKVQRATAGASFKLDNIFFDTGKATLKAESVPSLNNLHEILVKNDITIELGGHTDSVGSEESNQRLSQDRVNAVRMFLIQKNIPESRIVAKGYGETTPIASNATENGRAQNRRVEVKIIEKIKGVEGVDNKLVDKKVEEVVVVDDPAKTVSPDFDVLSRLQNAAKIGGLPKGSPCSGEVQYSSNKTYVPSTKKTTTTKRKPVNYTSSSSFFNTDQFEKSDYNYKSISVGIDNFKNNDMISNGAWAYDLNFTNRSRLESSGRVSENIFTFMPKEDNMNFGAGYEYMRFRSLKTIIGLPIGYIFGVEAKYLNFADPFNVGNDAVHTGFVTVPLGLKALINIKDLVISPSASYHLGLYGKDRFGSNVNSTYMEYEALVRWKLFYGGLGINSGANIKYFGIKAGITL